MIKKIPKISYVIISLILAPYLVLFELEVFKTVDEIGKHSQIVVSTTVTFFSWIWLSMHWGFYEKITDKTLFKDILIFISKRTIPTVIFLSVVTEGYDFYMMFFSEPALAVWEIWDLTVDVDSILIAAGLSAVAGTIFYTYGIREPKKSESARWVHMNPNLKHR